MSVPEVSIPAILGRGSAGAPSISAPDRPSLSFRGLRSLVDRVGAQLARTGIGRNDRVAIVLPNGPEMATSFLSIASHATTAPLNPAYGREEFDFYLSDLGAKALVVPEASDSPAVAAAVGLGIPILALSFDPAGPAGTFVLDGPAGAPPEQAGVAEPDDTALVLHTSGTTSRPKIVPLSHANVAATARHIRAGLALSEADTCLNIMPLFHIHGLMAAVLSTLAAGGSVFCTPGFNGVRVFRWLQEATPTWYTAVPTMHQAMLMRAEHSANILAAAHLRFIRSSSSSLPRQVMSELETAFDAPVIEAYGMTEAAHQMTSNPLPPGVRKPGTVGMAAGPEVAVMDPAGNLLEPGRTGEVVVRGPNVTSGYENNPGANAEAFTQGWFRTGDQGVLDGSGYLTLTGRLKEIINRGGEKVSPLEVDDVLMDHPAVRQAVTFAMPHPTLGEDVAAAIVLREGATATEREIRDYAASRLAAFKVPKRVLILDEIPKGATGKLQRIGLSDRLGLSG
jgi:acyl-CoA synthetase (AMP-forming)/AMP-acid ligase II